MSSKNQWMLVAMLASMLMAVLGFFLLQHRRHGWPFSLHHNLSPVSPGPRPATDDVEATRRVAHPRVEVELDEAQATVTGVRVEKVRIETISKPLRAAATVVPDESRVSHVHTRVAGWIEKLFVTRTGERVRAGQPIAGIFSQELLSTQNEYLAARRAQANGPTSAVVAGARARLKVLGMTDEEIEAIEASGQARRLVKVAAPRSGVVLRRGISVGTAVDPSTEIFTIADLSRIWVFAELPENDIPSVKVGTRALLEFPASGRKPFEASVVFLYPTLSERTRTLRVRFEIDNSGGSLRPGIFGTVTFAVSPRRALTVPRDAVVDTGASQHIFVVPSARRFVPREVTVGTRFEDRIEIREGLSEGESIVSSGVFLIDSESRLRASGGGTGHAHVAPSQAKPGGDAENHASHPSAEPEEAGAHLAPSVGMDGGAKTPRPIGGHQDHER